MSKIKESIAIMCQAQEIDGQLYWALQKLEEIPGQRAKLKSDLDAEKAHLLELEATLKKLQLNQKAKEGELAQKEGNVKKLDGQLSQVKTNKEYAALQQEIASLKADNSLMEEEIIRILDEVEAVHEEVKKEQERLKLCEKDYQNKERELAQEEKKLTDTADQFKKQRVDIIAKLPPDVKELYEKILIKKQGRALVKIKGEICEACQLRLRPQVINEIYLGERLVVCDNCSRILYCEENQYEQKKE